jgi:hypothetical protein
VIGLSAKGWQGLLVLLIAVCIGLCGAGVALMAERALRLARLYEADAAAAGLAGGPRVQELEVAGEVIEAKFPALCCVVCQQRLACGATVDTSCGTCEGREAE